MDKAAAIAWLNECARFFDRRPTLGEDITHWTNIYNSQNAKAISTLIDTLDAQLADERVEHDLLKELLSRPEIDDFWEGIVIEAAHQRQRWGDAHDRSKSAENWFWLVGYLSGKALRAAIEGDQVKAKHHTISTAAALFQWHKAICADESGHGVGSDEDIDPEAGRLGAEPTR